MVVVLPMFDLGSIPDLFPDSPQNMIAQSQSGTGKTAAFVLTMLSRVNAHDRFPQVALSSSKCWV